MYAAPGATHPSGGASRGDARHIHGLEDVYPADRDYPQERGIGDLVGAVASDFSTLVRQELELAKAEATEEAKKAGKAAGMFGGAGFGGYMVAMFGTWTVLFALAVVLPWWAAAFIVTVLWAAVAAVLASRGRKEMRRLNGMPLTKQTVQRDVVALKEDTTWSPTLSR